ncbi:MAG TPA: SDR family NAD(P)-dependent oxidoreductase [Thermoanaerobaculia bacterium]|nr:SDR family NAD(P)-dependent oxidoreductase [Thermoanaerobaculia bacterium]
MRAVITGASSGIGQAIARELSKRGWELLLLARRVDLIEKLPHSEAVQCDVTDAEAVKHAASGAFDLAIANAGVGIRNHAEGFNLTDAEQVIRVNVLGMMYLYDAVIPSMIERRSGRFAGVASLAGLRGLPSAAPYSASKAAMQAFLEASRVELAQFGVGVSIINPGFVTTPMTEKNRFRMPFLINAERAARIIVDGLEHGKRVIEFPRPMSLLMRTMRLAPDALYDRMMRSAGRKR